MTGAFRTLVPPSGAGQAGWDRELAEVARHARTNEHAPASALISNTMAAAAYAEAVTVGISDQTRRRLFDGIWVGRRHISSAYDVRRVSTGLMSPTVQITPYLRSELPRPLDHECDLSRIVRRSGGTIVADGAPLTTTGWRRDVHVGAESLTYLTGSSTGGRRHGARTRRQGRAAARAGGLRPAASTMQLCVTPCDWVARSMTGIVRAGSAAVL